jgi:hypothetical protein
MLNNTQMEFSLSKNVNHRPLRDCRDRLSRSQWWLAQMRRVVDEACEWQPNPAELPVRNRNSTFALLGR